jgi:hypothetical protein
MVIAMVTLINFKGGDIMFLSSTLQITSWENRGNSQQEFVIREIAKHPFAWPLVTAGGHIVKGLRE